MIVALVQMYREQARYLERIYKWTKRVGVAEIRRQVLDDAEQPQGALTTASSSRRNSRRSIPGRSASPACDKHEFRPLAASRHGEAAE